MDAGAAGGEGGGTLYREHERALVKLQSSSQTMQTAAEVCKLRKVDFWGVPVID